MYRSHTCGELRLNNQNQHVTLCGWVRRVRDKGHLLWIDLRDRYGFTQLYLEEGISAPELFEQARNLGREFVIQAEGEVIERASKNPNIPTGDIEVKVQKLTVLTEAQTPPFTIEDDSDGGEELRMKYRYLDIRRNPVKDKLILRHQVAQTVRNYLSDSDFLEVETPFLIKSTPEGARDFIVPSRMHQGEFYALPQSPQTFKQLLMVGGMDRYFQIVRCFRDEDLRADRQPEFTQIDCEMSFVTQEDIFKIFEGMVREVFKKVKGIDLPEFKHMPYSEAMRLYGVDKPDLRFGMAFVDFAPVAKNKGFKVFDDAEAVLGICAKGCASYSRKDLDKLTKWVQRPQIGAKGLVYVKINEDGSFKSSVDKFYSQEDLASWAELAGAEKGDLLLLLSGDLTKTQKALGELRLEMGNRLGLRDAETFAPLWVVDFPLLEWDEEHERFHAMHHPFTSPVQEDLTKLTEKPGEVRANAYDMVINGVELGGGSIRIHDRELQKRMFDALGFTEEEAQKQFGFLMDAFTYGAPPHGGIAFGFDRLCAMLGNDDSIRDYIAFPKNNAGRDVMIDAPAAADPVLLEELAVKIAEKKEEAEA